MINSRLTKNSKKLQMTILQVVVLLVISLGVSDISAMETYREEIIVRFEIPKMVEKDIFVQYDGQKIYMPIFEIFSIFDIKIESDPSLNVCKGFYINENNKFEIDLNKGTAKCFGNTIQIDNSNYIKTDNELYFTTNLFESIFNLKMNFDFSELKVFLPLNPDFPAYVKLKRQLSYKRLKSVKIKKQNVETLPYSWEWFKAGSADWTITTSPLGRSAHFGQLNLGMMLLGGDFTLQGGGNSVKGFETERLKYQWHYYANKMPYVSQVSIGEVNPGGTLSQNISGISVTNKPQIRKKYFQTINIDGQAGEGWDIELYMNNKLVDYTRTNADGTYTFLVDLNYGSTRIMIKKYGPNGEIEVEEKFYSFPYTLLKKNEYQYCAAIGKKTDGYKDIGFASANSYYGLFNSFTLGIATEAPFNTDSSKYKSAVALDLSYKVRGNFLLSGSISPSNFITGGFNFSIPGMLNMFASHTIYQKDSPKNSLNKKDNSLFSTSIPLKYKKFRLNLRYRVTFDRFYDRSITFMNYGFNTSFYRFHINYLGNFKKTDYYTRNLSNMASQIFASTSWIKWFRPQVRFNYDHNMNQLTKAGLYVNKRIFKKGQLTFSVERNMISHSNTFMLSFHIFNGFADFTSKVSAYENNISLVQTQKGSIQLNQEQMDVRFKRRNSVGFGTAVIYPFLDGNYNGLHDEDEEIIANLQAKLKGASMSRFGKENLWYYDRLRPYNEYIIDIDQYSLDNPQLLPSHDAYKVIINPNSVTSIYVPIITAGEVSGMIEREVENGKIGVGGVRIFVINEQTNKKTEILTFNNGEYFYLGLPPGMYRAEIDKEQLSKSGYKSQPESIPFQVKTVENGDFVDNINFILTADN